METKASIARWSGTTNLRTRRMAAAGSKGGLRIFGVDLDDVVRIVHAFALRKVYLTVTRCVQRCEPRPSRCDTGAHRDSPQRGRDHRTSNRHEAITPVGARAVKASVDTILAMAGGLTAKLNRLAEVGSFKKSSGLRYIKVSTSLADVDRRWYRRRHIEFRR